MRAFPNKGSGSPGTSPLPPRFRVGDVEVTPDSGSVSGPRGDAQLDPKVMAVLACLAQARGELVPRDQIMENVWAGVVVTDFALSRCVYQLRKVLIEVSAAATPPIETLPKRGYRLAWEISAGAHTPSSPRQPVSTNRVTWGIVAVALAAVVAGLAINASRTAPDARALEITPNFPVRVAVLPLEDVSPDGSQAVFASGLTREIVHQIARLPVVVAVGRDSVFGTAEGRAPDLETARLLEVELLLSGSVNALGTARRILVDLRTVPEGELLWSHSYLIEEDAPFVMLPDVASSVAQALDFNANGASARMATENLAAFEAYVAAGEADNDDVKRQLLERALELDPRFAAAWNALAAIEIMPSWNGLVTIDDAWHRAKPYLDRALEIDPESPQTLVTLGRFQRNRGETEAAIASFSRALELDPGYGWASANLGLALRWTGRYEEALAIHAAAVTMDPLSPAAQTRLGTSHWLMGHFDEAARHYQRAIDLDPSYEEVYDSWSGMLAFGLGRFDDALTMMGRKMGVKAEPSVRTLTAVGSLASILGNDTEAMAYWQRAAEINPDYVDIHHNLARHHLVQGESVAARRSALTALHLFPADADAQLVLAILDLESGDHLAFVDRIRAAYPAYFDGVPDLPAAHLDVALLVAQAMGEAGMVDEKLRLLSAIEDSIDTPRARQHVWLAAVHAIRDETELALQYLNASPPGRVREVAALLMRDPRFASLREDSEFQTLIAQHLAALRAQAASAWEDHSPGSVPATGASGAAPQYAAGNALR